MRPASVHSGVRRGVSALTCEETFSSRLSNHSEDNLSCSNGDKAAGPSEAKHRREQDLLRNCQAEAIRGGTELPCHVYGPNLQERNRQERCQTLTKAGRARGFKKQTATPGWFPPGPAELWSSRAARALALPFSNSAAS
ncbi:hypothetical protein NDU88_010816 [Pleurodeles waltl]|uniref:Uncharacterized protein n=1 Tax=Pleurodeles waltl TaxID=8319 RepID=A0AAV7QWT0_PLEWA|nr:hypothetical protein NDU88_010816 [Pleurodeles waltl]